jgi:hypothetical protein
LCVTNKIESNPGAREALLSHIPPEPSWPIPSPRPVPPPASSAWPVPPPSSPPPPTSPARPTPGAPLAAAGGAPPSVALPRILTRTARPGLEKYRRRSTAADWASRLRRCARGARWCAAHGGVSTAVWRKHYTREHYGGCPGLHNRQPKTERQPTDDQGLPIPHKLMHPEGSKSRAVYGTAVRLRRRAVERRGRVAVLGAGTHGEHV